MLFIQLPHLDINHFCLCQIQIQIQIQRADKKGSSAESNAAACSIGNLLAFNLFITPAFVHFHCCDKSINLHFFGMS